MRKSSRWLAFGLGFGLIIFCIAAVIRDIGQYNQSVDTYYESAEPDDAVAESPTTDVATDDFTTVMVYWPGLKVPPALPAAKAPLDDDAVVIGVVANGTSRAYLLDAFKLLADTVEEFGGGDKETWKLEQRREPLSQLVVNDVLGGVPITVTFSEIPQPETGQNVRVLTSSGEQGALDVWLAELQEKAVILNYQGTNFSLWSAEPPLQDHAFQLMTWKSWRKDHPDTDAYIGGVRLYSGELKDNPSVVYRPDADAQTLFTSASLQYRHHTEDGLDVEMVYDVLDMDPTLAEAHDLLAEYFDAKRNLIMRETHRAKAIEARKQRQPQPQSP